MSVSNGGAGGAPGGVGGEHSDKCVGMAPSVWSRELVDDRLSGG